jgi:hypothetical protein
VDQPAEPVSPLNLNWQSTRPGHETKRTLRGSWGGEANGTPTSLVGTAGYLLEYSALLPIQRLLRKQDIPHAVLFRRAAFDSVGQYPEDTLSGEDTLFNRRCVRAGLSVGYAPRAGLAHRNLTSVRELLAHARAHGRGLAQCVDRYGLGSVIGAPNQALATGAARMLVLYPLLGIWTKVKRMARFAPRRLPQLIGLSPLIFAALVATGWGAWSESRAARVRAPLGPKTSRASG